MLINSHSVLYDPDLWLCGIIITATMSLTTKAVSLFLNEKKNLRMIDSCYFMTTRLHFMTEHRNNRYTIIKTISVYLLATHTPEKQFCDKILKCIIIFVGTFIIILEATPMKRSQKLWSAF